MKRQHRARFRLLTVVQIALLITSILLLAWSVVETEFIAVPLVVGFVVGLQTVALLRHVEAHIDSLEDFFAAVNYEDFTRRFIGDDVDTELKEAFNRVLSKFQDARAETELQTSYLETIVRHVPIPFIAARPDGAVTLVNIPARQLTGLAALTRIDQLAELDLALPGLMRSIEPGRQQLLQTKLRGVPAELRVSVSEIRMAAGNERLYSIENLSGELTAREASAWRNLIRVLTHEIMNTLTPVTSLAETTVSLLDNPDAKNDVRQSVETISRRSEGLMKFVLRYRELLKVPHPIPAIVSVASALHTVRTLMSDELTGVQVTIDVSPETLELTADVDLLDQVLINLVRNSLDAMKGTELPQLEMRGRLSFGRILISVRDNGHGIDAETIEQIFVPFFTTKREGSGIGLSLSRQIMSAHGGEIAVESDTNGTIARLIF